MLREAAEEKEQYQQQQQIGYAPLPLLIVDKIGEVFCDILLSRNLPVRQDVFDLLLSIEAGEKDKFNSLRSLKFMFIFPFDFLLDVPR